MSQEFEKKIREFCEFMNEKTGMIRSPEQEDTGVICIEKKYIDEFNEKRTELQKEMEKNQKHKKHHVCEVVLALLDICYKEKSSVRPNFPQANIFIPYTDYVSNFQELEN